MEFMTVEDLEVGDEIIINKAFMEEVKFSKEAINAVGDKSVIIEKIILVPGNCPIRMYVIGYNIELPFQLDDIRYNPIEIIRLKND